MVDSDEDLCIITASLGLFVLCAAHLSSPLQSSKPTSSRAHLFFFCQFNATPASPCPLPWDPSPITAKKPSRRHARPCRWGKSASGPKSVRRLACVVFFWAKGGARKTLTREGTTFRVELMESVWSVPRLSLSLHCFAGGDAREASKQASKSGKDGGQGKATQKADRGPLFMQVQDGGLGKA